MISSSVTNNIQRSNLFSTEEDNCQLFYYLQLLTSFTKIYYIRNIHFYWNQLCKNTTTNFPQGPKKNQNSTTGFTQDIKITHGEGNYKNHIWNLSYEYIQVNQCVWQCCTHCPHNWVTNWLHLSYNKFIWLKDCSKEDEHCSLQSGNCTRKMENINKPLDFGYVLKSHCFPLMKVSRGFTV